MRSFIFSITLLDHARFFDFDCESPLTIIDIFHIECTRCEYGWIGLESEELLEILRRCLLERWIGKSVDKSLEGNNSHSCESWRYISSVPPRAVVREVRDLEIISPLFLYIIDPRDSVFEDIRSVEFDLLCVHREK